MYLYQAEIRGLKDTFWRELEGTVEEVDTGEKPIVTGDIN